jgi:diacylglycerol kinase family enzyme
MSYAIPVLINRSGGIAASLGDRLRSTVEEAFAPLHREIALELLTGAEIEAAVKRHAGHPLVVVGGGDGTLASAAAVLAHTSSALGILPMGTRNHLARQLSIPCDLAEAAGVIGKGQRRRIDLGIAGERIFVNNASFGIYTRLVRQRDAGRGPKWLKTIPATWHVLRHMRSQLFPVWIDGEAKELATPLLFIGNNAYSMERGQIGERESMSDGELSIFAISSKSRVGLAAFAARAMLGFARPEEDFEECDTAREIIIEGHGEIEGAFDGELATLSLPLRIRTLPNALGIVTPRETVAGEGTLSRTHRETGALGGRS